MRRTHDDATAVTESTSSSVTTSVVSPGTHATVAAGSSLTTSEFSQTAELSDGRGEESKSLGTRNNNLKATKNHPTPFELKSPDIGLIQPSGVPSSRQSTSSARNGNISGSTTTRTGSTTGLTVDLSSHLEMANELENARSTIADLEDRLRSRDVQDQAVRPVQKNRENQTVLPSSQKPQSIMNKKSQQPNRNEVEFVEGQEDTRHAGSWKRRIMWFMGAALLLGGAISGAVIVLASSSSGTNDIVVPDTESPPHQFSKAPFDTPVATPGPFPSPLSSLPATDALPDDSTSSSPSAASIITMPPSTSFPSGAIITSPDPTAAPKTTPGTNTPVATPQPQTPPELPTQTPVFPITPGPGPTHVPSPELTTANPTKLPTYPPSPSPTKIPTTRPTRRPSSQPTSNPTRHPTRSPSHRPTTTRPTSRPTEAPTKSPTAHPTARPTRDPTSSPTKQPTQHPTQSPTISRRGFWLQLTLDSSSFTTVNAWDAYLLSNTNTPQAKALVWLTETDEYTESYDQMDSDELLERYAFVVFYYSTSGPDWDTKVTYLDSKTSICEWNAGNEPDLEGYVENDEGFYCASSDSPSLATHIHFFSISALQGTIPSEISLLSNLLSLTIWDSGQLSGTLPAILPRSLKYFDIVGDNNAISGTLPSLWGNTVANLDFVQIRDCDIEGTIPSEWGNLQKMSVLDLCINMVSGTIPSTLGLIGSNMLAIYLHQNPLTGTLPSQLSNLESLIDFVVDHNPQLEGSIPSEYSNLSSLYTFSISSTSIEGSLEMFCNRDIDPPYMFANCWDTNPNVECSCCYVCCSDDGSACYYM